MVSIHPEVLMYGMVNRSMEDMVVGQHGEEMWERMACFCVGT